MGYIASIVKDKALNKVFTTKDLIYKEKVIDIHNIEETYNKNIWHGTDIKTLFRKNKNQKLKYLKHNLKFDESPYFYNFSFETTLKLVKFNFQLFEKINPHKEHQIDFLKGKLNDFLISEIHNSLWIEGIRSSKKRIKQLINDNKVYETDKNDIKNIIIKNFIEALNFILSTDEVNEANLFALYTILTKDIDMKNNKLDSYPYRLEDVIIGDEKNKGIEASKIKASMDQIFDLISSSSEADFFEKNIQNGDKHIFAKNIHHFIEGLLIHLNFEHIHPYYDMNGRMGRLLTLWYMKKNEVFFDGLYFSEAINLFKHEFYYPAFKKTKVNNFKFDATYFVSSLLSSLVAHKICLLEFNDINKKVKNKYKKRLNLLERDIVVNLLSKEKGEFYIASDFILGSNEINPASISKSLKNLVNFGILNEVNSKPKEYKLIWNKNVEKKINEVFKILK